MMQQEFMDSIFFLPTSLFASERDIVDEQNNNDGGLWPACDVASVYDV